MRFRKIWKKEHRANKVKANFARVFGGKGYPVSGVSKKGSHY